MAYVKLTALLRIFYETGLPFLPVTEAGLKGESALLGFLSRRFIDKELADIERSAREYDFIPDRLLIKNELPESLLETVKSGLKIPVYDSLGRRIGEWDSVELLSHWKKLNSSVTPPGPDEPVMEVPGTPANDGNWLAEAILSTLDYPILVTDLEGNTLFYNGPYEEIILNHSAFRKNPALAETFFLELNRGLLAQSLTMNHESGYPNQSRMSWIESLQCMMEVKDLYTDGFLNGYIYSFFRTGDTGSLKEVSVWLESGRGLTEIIEDIESHIIYSYLKKFGQNISHAAAALQMSRSTLQSRIKMLSIDEKFQRVVEGPVRRIRKPKSLPPEPAAAVKKRNIKESKKSPSKKTKKKTSSGK